MTLAGYNLQDNVYIYSNNKCMCVFLISPVPIAEPLTSELIDTPVFYNLAPRPIKYRVSVPIPSVHRSALQLLNPLRDALASASSSGDHVEEEKRRRSFRRLNKTLQ